VNDKGVLFFWGTGVFGTFYEPRVVIDADIVDVSVGGSFGIAQDKEGLLWSWGTNSNGELGHSDLKTRIYPQPIMQLKRKAIRKVVCGGQFVIAVGRDKSISTKDKQRKNHSLKSNISDERPKRLKSSRSKENITPG
jgi:alpha-tubulin suppressor-like RCC1 family protein